MITKPQAKLIKKVCDIQFESLEQIIAAPELDEETSELMGIFNVSRKEFDESIVTIYNRFIRLKENPENLGELDYETLLVFIFILKHVSEEYRDRYPNAIENLTNKVFLLLNVKENLN